MARFTYLHLHISVDLAIMLYKKVPSTQKNLYLHICLFETDSLSGFPVSKEIYPHSGTGMLRDVIRC